MNEIIVQWNLDLRKPDLKKNLDLRKIVGTTDYLVHKLFDLRKLFKGKKDFFPKSGKDRVFLAILEQFWEVFRVFFNFWINIPQFNLYFFKKIV